MEKHVTILGILYIAFSVLGILGGLIVMAVLTGAGIVATTAGEQTPVGLLPFLAGLGTVIGGAIIVLSAIGIIAGAGLLKFKPWARVLALVLGIISLLNVPIGTLLGIYALWVLLSAEGAKLFAKEAVSATSAGA